MAEGPGARLLAWFHRRQRQLPWRSPFPRDPYPTLVSEVMLQQTQVERVVPLFTRFMELFPTVAALAASAEHDVVRAFSGLGYYRRARLLHAAARAVAAAGVWPQTPAALRGLPGVGPYTAAAVAAFCFAGDEPPVDGNIARITARVGAIEARTGERRLSQAAAEFAASLFAETGTPETWEALMELGATVCTAAPLCAECPFERGCAARAQGRPATLPLPRRTRAPERHHWVALWLARQDGRVLLRQVPDGEPLAGVWLVPHAPIAVGDDPAVAARELARRAGHHGEVMARPRVRHTITYRNLEVFPFVARSHAGRIAERRPELRWVDPAWPDVAVPTLFAKLRDRCGDGGTGPTLSRPRALRRPQE